jgi:ATP-dependent DNA helicase DinG
LDRVIKVFDSFSNSTDSVVARWVEIYDRSNGQKEYSIEQRPTNVAGALKRTLWSRAHAVVVTSATLRSMGGFEHFRLKAGLPREPEAAYVDLESPFDYSRAALRIPTHAGADPANAKNHTDYIILSLPDLIESSGGTLVLFSSKAQLLKVREGLPEGVAQIILSQNDMPKNVLLAEHARRIAQGLPSVIFGLASFAEGVDLPGDLCRHVIIAKLPFEPPGGPVEATIAEAIEARGGNVFMEIMLPNVCIRLIQAVGRLIRQETDQGTITILDSRLKTKRYGRSLLSNLPSELRTIT